MKNVLLVILMTLTQFAISQEIKISTYLKESTLELDPTFAHNASLGRAWVEVNVREFTDFYSADYDLTFDQIEKFKVEGLSYDNIKNQIIFTNTDGKNTVCVDSIPHKKKPHKFKLKVTNNCLFRLKSIVKDVDDGFQVYKVSYLELYLQINNK